MNRFLTASAQRLHHVRNTIQAWTQSDPAQAGALRRVFAFFMAMLLLTLVARGTSGATMPQVKTVHPGAGSVVQTVRATGTVLPQSSIQLTAPEGLFIRQVLIQPGSTVAEGDAIAVLDCDAVDSELAVQKAEVIQLKAQLTELQRAQAVDSCAMETAQLALTQAQQNYDAADKSDEETLRTLQQALAQAQLSYDQAVRSYQQAADAAGAQQQQNAAAATGVRLQITTAETRVKALKAVQQAGYLLPADASGTVQNVMLSEGGETEKIAATLYDTASPLQFSCTLPQDTAKKLAVGMPIELVQGTNTVKATVSSLSPPDAQGNVTASAVLAAGSLVSGETMATVTLSQEQFAQTVPLAAVHTDTGGSFVYRVEQQDTVLGLKSVTVRAQITVLQSNDTTAAISSALGAEDVVIVSATKPLTAGCKVRLEP